MKTHRKLGFILALPIFAWSLSGLLHPMMANWFKPEIARTFLIPKPLTNTADLVDPSSAFADLEQLHQFRLISLDGEPTYLGISPDQKLHYRSATTGKSIENALETHSIQLARAYSEDGESAVKSVTEITEFGPDYSYINRLLPAQRVSFENESGLEVVVDPRTGRLATYDDPAKRVFTTAFDYLHTWSFLGPRDSKLRISVVLFFSLLALVLTFSGIRMLRKFKSSHKSGTKRKLSPARRAHRTLASISVVLFLMFSVSGAFHVFSKIDYDDSTQWVSEQCIDVGSLSYSPHQAILSAKRPVKSLSLAVIDGQPFYRLALMDRDNPLNVKMIHATTGEVLEEGEEIYARQLALEFSGYQASDIATTEPISSFRPDYGFIFKRVPVWRIKFSDQDYWQYTVDTSDAHMSMRTSPQSLADALVFINLHKWHFLDPISKELRDYATAIAVLLIAATTLAGMLLLIRKKRNRRQSTSHSSTK